MELPPKYPLNSGHIFFGTEHTKCNLGLSCYFTAMSTVALLAAIVGVTPLLLLAAKHFSRSPSSCVSFIFVCCFVFVK
jgi:hypothetical protein